MTESPIPAVTPDPLLDEVRERRRAVFASCGYDLRMLGERIRQLQGQHPEQVVDRRRMRAGRRGRE